MVGTVIDASPPPDLPRLQGADRPAGGPCRGPRRTGGRFVYDIADIHTEAARLARMPGWFRALVRGRERGWMAEAAGLTAVSAGVADEVVACSASPDRPSS